MAVREHLRCPACGTPRPLSVYGLDSDGHPTGEPDPEHNAEVCIQTLAGKITWHSARPARHVLEILRDRLRGALERVEAMLED